MNIFCRWQIDASFDDTYALATHVAEVADARLKLAQPKVFSFYEYSSA
jgi:hypothetical protein